MPPASKPHREFFSGLVALVTGAGSGLGRELARQLAEHGAKVGAVDLQAVPLADLAAAVSPHSLAWAAADVADRPALDAAVASLQERLGPIDLLVANAGIGFETTALAFRAEDFEKIIHVNLMGTVNSIAAVLPGMIQRRRGRLAAISSLASFRGMPRMAGYCASKAGVNALLDSLRIELQPHGISVTTICPGWIRTPMTADLLIPMPRRLEPADAARHTLEAIRQGRSFFAFPAQDAWSARLLGWLPCSLSDWLVRRLLPF